MCAFLAPALIQKKGARNEEEGRKKGQGKGKHDATRTNYRNAPDFANAGVAIVIKRTLVCSLKNVKQIDGRIIKATFAASGADVSFFAAYAPHSAYDVEAKEAFYDKLSDEILNTRGTYYIGGDFNARLHYVRNIDKEVCGTHILGRGMAYLDGMSESTKENRALFLGFCKIHALNVMNTQLPKPPHKLITYKEKCSGSEESQDIGPSYDAQRFAQIDFWVAGDSWKSNVKDTQSRIDVHFDSDHFILESRITIKNLIHKVPEAEHTKRFYKPTLERWTNYNLQIRQLISNEPLSWETFSEAVIIAADTQLEKIPPQKNKSYISRGTWAKVAKRNQGRLRGMTNAEVKHLNKDIARSAKRDKQNSLIEKFNENPNDAQKKGLWKAVRNLKKKFTPKYVKMKNEEGKHVPLICRAETVAEYLENKHWKNEAEGQPCRNKIVENNNADESCFTIQELNAALKRMKCDKQNGPDGIIAELWKWLDAEN